MSSSLEQRGFRVVGGCFCITDRAVRWIRCAGVFLCSLPLHVGLLKYQGFCVIIPIPKDQS